MARRGQEKSRQTKRELMTAAIALFGEKGFFATTVSEITQKAGYAKGSFYRHFSGKDALMLTIIEHKLGDYRRARSEKLEQAGTLEEMYDVIWDFLGSIIEDKKWSRVFLEFAIHASRDAGLRTELNKSGYRLSNDIFSRLIKDFVPPGYPTDRVGSLNTALFEGFLIQSILETSVLTRDDVKRAALILARSAESEVHGED